MRPARGSGGNTPAASITTLGIAGFFLLDAMQAFGVIDRLVYGNWFGKSGDKITQGLNLLLLGSGLMLFARAWDRNRAMGIGAGFAYFVVFYLFLTALWSVDPATTMREAMVYLFVVLGCIGVAGSLTCDEFMRVLGAVCFLSALASLLLLAVSPGAAMMADGSDFQGIFAHKNFLGQVMATGAFTSLYALRNGTRRWLATVVMFFVFFVVAVMSKSTTSLMLIVTFSAIELLMLLYRRGGAIRVIGISGAVCCLPLLLMAAANPDPLLELLGKDPTLTGRTEIWQYVEQDIAMRPALGWGYFAFWTVANPAAMDIANTVKWFVPQAHNGLLELLLNVGAVGTLLFVAFFLRNVRFALSCLRTPAQALGISTLIYCSGILLLSISENVLLAPTQSSTTVFLITGLMCEHALRAGRRQIAALSPWPPSGTPRHRSVTDLEQFGRPAPAAR
jgi:O-antigen ligase